MEILAKTPFIDSHRSTNRAYSVSGPSWCQHVFRTPGCLVHGHQAHRMGRLSPGKPEDGGRYGDYRCFVYRCKCATACRSAVDLPDPFRRSCHLVCHTEIALANHRISTCFMD